MSDEKCAVMSIITMTKKQNIAKKKKKKHSLVWI